MNPENYSIVMRGVGSATPETRLTNAELTARVETSDEWITTRTGIKERRIAGDSLQLSEIAAEAGRKALANAGMNPEESRALSGLIEEIRERFKLTILLIEHHMDVVMRVCAHIVVINFGALLADGPPDKVRTDERVLQAYLGKEYRNA